MMTEGEVCADGLELRRNGLPRKARAPQDNYSGQLHGSWIKSGVRLVAIAAEFWPSGECRFR